MPMSVLRGPDAAGLLTFGKPEPDDGGDDEDARDQEEALAHHLRALGVLSKHTLGFGALLPFFAL